MNRFYQYRDNRRMIFMTMKREKSCSSTQRTMTTWVLREDMVVGHRLDHHQALHTMQLGARHLRHPKPRQEEIHRSIMEFEKIGIILSLVRRAEWRSHLRSARVERPLWEMNWTRMFRWRGETRKR